MTSRPSHAVLTSGGVDSAVLVADLARRGWSVQPLYIRFGLTWEATEEAHLRRFLNALPANLQAEPLVVFDLPIADLYGAHWSVSGAGVPDDTTPDSAVYLPGRNLLLLAKCSVWCPALRSQRHPSLPSRGRRAAPGKRSTSGHEQCRCH